MNKRVRQYLGIAVAILLYYFIHEGAHFLYAVLSGSFRQVNFMGIGVQIDVYQDRMTDMQMGIFCIAGAVATLVMLFLDPVYLGVFCSLFGGGDMNGIRMLMPEWIE